jgi:hypothetical protein
MIFKTQDGESLTGDSPTEILEALRDGSRFASDQPLDEFLADFAQRLEQFNGVMIGPTDEKNHGWLLNALVEHGYLTPVDDRATDR